MRPVLFATMLACDLAPRASAYFSDGVTGFYIEITSIQFQKSEFGMDEQTEFVEL